MIVLGPRVLAAAVLGSRLLRSAIFPGQSAVDQLDADVQAFRQELARGHRLLSTTNTALEACHHEGEIQKFLLKFSGIAELILLGLFVWHCRCKRPSEGSQRGAVAEDREESAVESETEPSPPASKAQVVERRGPVTPSALQVAQNPIDRYHGRKSSNLGSSRAPDTATLPR